MFKIIQATEKHIENIQKIAYATWGNTYKDILSEDQLNYMLEKMYSQKAILEQLENENFKYFICIYSDISIGFVGLETNHKNEPITKIHKLYILPDYQGKGVGKLLIDQATKTALNNNNSTLVLNVNKQNSAKIFYEKLGFTVSYQEVINIGNGYVMDDFVMKKNVNL